MGYTLNIHDIMCKWSNKESTYKIDIRDVGNKIDGALENIKNKSG